MAKPKPLKNPFVQIDGEMYLVMNWYDEAETAWPSELRLQRLNANEVKRMYRHLTYEEAYAVVQTVVRRRLGFAKPHDTDSKEKK